MIQKEKKQYSLDLQKFYEIFCADDLDTEIRMLKTNKGTISGYYDAEHYADIEKHIRNYDGRFNIFFTLNQVDGNVTARSHNHLTIWAQNTTKDSEIIRRKWILIDLDPVRPAGVSSTDEELRYAEELSRKVEEFLLSSHFPSMVKAMSGNGCHILVPIDLPNEPEVTKTVKSFLSALDIRFSNENVKVDITTYNAARITKLYGTVACKGDCTAERPHRRSYIVSAPDKMEPASMELLQSVIKKCGTKKGTEKKVSKKSLSGEKKFRSGAGRTSLPARQNFDIREYCNNHGIEISHESRFRTVSAMCFHAVHGMMNMLWTKAHILRSFPMKKLLQAVIMIPAIVKIGRHY